MASIFSLTISALVNSLARAQWMIVTLCSLYLCAFVTNTQASIHIVAAENFYGEVAKEMGGPYVNVVSILNNPNQDPHLFTTSPSTSVALTTADIIVYNGADYDPWMQSILSNQKSSHIIIVANLMNIKKGANPHIWYLPETMPTFAKNLVALLNQMDPAHRAYFQAQLNRFNQSYLPIFAKIQTLKQRFDTQPVIATEPVFNDMTNAIGLKMQDEAFQWSMMNDVPPSISEVKKFEDNLHQHAVRVFIFNNQVINPTTQRMLSIAKNEKIPVVGVSELMPANITYVQWIMQALNQLESALAASKDIHHDTTR